MRFECGSAIWADDAQVLEPVVVRNPVDVVDDERHLNPAPFLALAADLALSFLQPGFVESSLERRPVVCRVGRQHLLERHRSMSAHLCRAGLFGIEVIGRDLPDLVHVFAKEPVIAACWPETSFCRASENRATTQRPLWPRSRNMLARTSVRICCGRKYAPATALPLLDCSLLETLLGGRPTGSDTGFWSRRSGFESLPPSGPLHDRCPLGAPQHHPRRVPAAGDRVRTLGTRS